MPRGISHQLPAQITSALFQWGSVPSAPGNQGSIFIFGGAVWSDCSLSTWRESCCQQWSRSATDSVKKGHRHACHCFSRGWAVGTQGAGLSSSGLLCPCLDQLKVQKIKVTLGLWVAPHSPGLSLCGWPWGPSRHAEGNVTLQSCQRRRGSPASPDFPRASHLRWRLPRQVAETIRVGRRANCHPMVSCNDRSGACMRLISSQPREVQEELKQLFI